MDTGEKVEALAQRLYEARHPSPEFPAWADLDAVKSYKPRKYRQLAAVAIAFLAS